jgi:hypothetical protein
MKYDKDGYIIKCDGFPVHDLFYDENGKGDTEEDRCSFVFVIDEGNVQILSQWGRCANQPPKWTVEKLVKVNWQML